MKPGILLSILILASGCIFDSGKSDDIKLYPESDIYGYMNMLSSFQRMINFDKSIAMINNEENYITLYLYNSESKILLKAYPQGTKSGIYHAYNGRLNNWELDMKKVRYFAFSYYFDTGNSWMDLTIDSMENNIITGSFAGLFHIITITGKFSIPYPDSIL